MVPQRLIVKGSKGFKSGIGIDEIDLDLSSLPSGLIAITGQNGVGKTTLMDSLPPFRLMPFKCRKSADWGVGSFSYYDHFDGRDCKIERWWSMGGYDYRSLILIDTVARKQECYLFQGDKCLNDGKAKTYDLAVEEIVGSPNMFFSSVYRAQGARSLSDYRRSEIMAILSELLNLEHIRVQGEKCKAVASALSAQLVSLRERIANLAVEAEKLPELESFIRDAVTQCQDDHMALDHATFDLEALRLDIARLREKQAALEAESGRLKLLQSNLEELKTRISDGASKHAAAEQDFDRRIAAAKGAHGKWLLETNQKISRAETIVSRADEIRAAVAQENILTAELADLKYRLTHLWSALEEATSVHSGWSHKHSIVQERIRTARAECEKLEGIDCRGDGSGWVNSSCRFVSSAVESKSLLPVLEGELAEASDSLNKCVSASGSARGEYNECKARIEVVEDKLSSVRAVARLLPELERAESDLHELRLEVVLREKTVAYELSTLEGDKWHAASGWDLERMRLEGEERKLSDEIMAFPVAFDYAGKISELLRKEDDVNKGIRLLNVRIREYETHVAGLEVKSASARSAGEQIAVLRGQESKLVENISKFSKLQRAFSNDGIIALEIDDSGAGISSIANELLSSCYGGRFSLRFETQTEKVNGDMKETFDVMVYDSEVDAPRSLTEVSGGQSAWLNDCLTRAICLYNIQTRGREYGTLFADEVDGALDAGRKLEFLAVKRKALEIGTHSREFFISQSPELIEMADARIVLEKGRVYLA